MDVWVRERERERERVKKRERERGRNVKNDFIDRDNWLVWTGEK
jgi:hypothetical protein